MVTMEQLLDQYISSEYDTKEVIRSIHDDHLGDWTNFLQALSRDKTNDEMLMKVMLVIGLKLTRFSSKKELSKLGRRSRDKQRHLLSVTCSNKSFIQTVREKVIEWSLKPDKKQQLGHMYLLLSAFCKAVLEDDPCLGAQSLCNL